MSRKKAVEPIAESQPVLPDFSTISDDDLCRRYFELKDWLEAETKRLAEHFKPFKTEMEQIEGDFLRRLNERKADNTKTEHGTAYKSTLLNPTISDDGAPYTNSDGVEVRGREALLDFSLDQWNEIGSELLLFQAQKDAIRRYMEEHDGQPPPGISVSYFTRCNIKRS